MMVIIDSWIIPSSLTIAAVLAVRFALRGKISLRLQYALWAVVLVRLLLPFQIFISPLSADAVVEKLNVPGVMQQAYISANEEQYQRQYDATYHESVRRYESRNQQVDPVVVEREAAEYAQLSLALDLRLHLVNLWLQGMAVMTAVIVACNLHLALRLKRRRWEYPATDSLLPVYVTAAVPTPCIFGLFHPAIYLTPEVAQDEQIRHHVLTHELTHYRHWDHVWSVLRSVCLVLHWYNPLVWIAARVSRADAELACDEGALAKLGEAHRADYGRTLIGLTCADHGGSMFISATTMTGSAGSIRERIRLLMKHPRNTILTLTAVILAGVLIVGCTFSGAPATMEPTEPSAPSADSYHEEELPTPEKSMEADITATVDAFFQACEENQYLNTDNSYDHLTILAADPDRTVACQGKTVPLSDFHGNIEYLHGKEAYWKHVRQEQGIARSGFNVTTHVDGIRYDGDAAIVQVGVGITFTYTDSAASSGMGKEFELLLVQVDDAWLIADVTERNDWFDAEYKHNPDFDPDALIASHIPDA